MKTRRIRMLDIFIRCCFVCCVMLGVGCSWLQNEFFSLDRAAPQQEKPPAELKAGTDPRW